MTRISTISLILLAGSGVILAQDQPPAGGWRRVGDPPPVSQEQNAPPVQGQTATAQGQDPTQPVDRSDAYGQPQQSAPPQQSAQPQAQPSEFPRQLPGQPSGQPSGQQGDSQRNDRPPAARMAAPAYGLPPQLTIKPGTFVTVRTNQPLSSDRNQEGDVFSATLTQPVVVDGVVVAQRGQAVMGRVAEAKKAGRAAGVSHLSLQLTGLTLADGTQAGVQSQMITRNGQTSVGNDVAAVGATTAVGAGIGAAADWGRGAAIGAGAGAIAGLAGVMLTRGHPTVVYPETLLTFRIDTPVTVSTAQAPQAFRYVDPYEYDRPVQTQTQVVRRPSPYYNGGAPAPYYVGAPSPYYYGGYYGGYYGPSYGYGPYWGWGGFGGAIVIGGRGGFRRFR